MKNNSLIWIFLLLLLLPTAAGRFLIDIAGSLIIFLLFLPFFLSGIGWIAWKVIKNNMRTCNACGYVFLDNSLDCPICSSNPFINQSLNYEGDSKQDSVTIDVKAEEN